MFLRAKIGKKDGKEHRYWSVVENRRVGGGLVVQRQVLYLGEINDTQELAWRRSIEVLEDGAAHPRSLRDLTICRKIYDTPNPDLRESGLSCQVRLLRALRREDTGAARQIMYKHMCTAERYMEEREAVVQSRFRRIFD
jgi:hypothetical protein